MNRFFATFGLCIATFSIHAPAVPPAEINLRHTVTVDVVQQTKDAVVNISTTKMISQRMSPIGRDPFWQFFDPGDVVKVPASSLGSGFIIHESGYIVTNHHVVDRARQIDVELADGRKLPAELISSDAESDLAILKISSDKPLLALPLGDSSDLLIGESVIAVGNPMGFSHSVSTGIVSANHRELRDERDEVLLSDLIQTDAAINPGNSGGPLLNAYGQVIGINTAIRGDAQNIGFAIHVNRLRDLIPELMNPTQVTKVDISEMHFTEVRHLKPPAAIEVAIEWGIQPAGRKIVESINGQPVRHIVDVYVILLQLRAGDSATLKIRGGAEHRLTATAAPLPDAVVKARQRLGVMVEPLNAMLSQKYGIETEDGLFINEVVHNSVAARAGLQPGDVIVQLGRYRVATLKDFASLLQHLPDEGRVRIGVIRGNQVGYGTLELSPRPAPEG